MKTCKECGATLPLTFFYVHPNMLDGHLNFCKECVKARVKTHNQAPATRMNNRIHSRKKTARGQNRAHKAVQRAVQRGILVREPCEVCGEPDSQAHHEDYSRPLDVRWLCSEHHGEVHRIRDYTRFEQSLAS